MNNNNNIFHCFFFFTSFGWLSKMINSIFHEIRKKKKKNVCCDSYDVMAADQYLLNAFFFFFRRFCYFMLLLRCNMHAWMTLTRASKGFGSIVFIYLHPPNWLKFHLPLTNGEQQQKFDEKWIMKEEFKYMCTVYVFHTFCFRHSQKLVAIGSDKLFAIAC